MKPKKLFAFELLVKLEKVDVILRRGTEKERRQKKYELIFESLQLAREAAVADVSATIPQIRKEEYKRGFEEGKQEATEGCSCGNDVVYLSYCMECLHDLEVKAEQRGYEKGYKNGQMDEVERANGSALPDDVIEAIIRGEDILEKAEQEGAQAERERWKKAICATDTIDAPEGGVIGVKAYWVDLEKLKEQGVKI